MKSKGIWLGLGIFLAVLVAGLVFASRKPQNNQQPTQTTEVATPTPTQEEDQKEATDEDVQEITIEAMEYSFSPKTITVAAGSKVRLTLVNKGRMSHDFVIEGEEITTRLVAPGESATLEFTLADAGTYTYYCSVGLHRALGMEGSLEVN
jgi:plastocyanin